MCAFPLKTSFVAHPLALLAACFACGIALTHLFSSPLLLLPCLLGGGTASALSLLFFIKRREWPASILLMLAFFCGGGAEAAVGQGRIKPNRIAHLYAQGLLVSGSPVELTGVLVSEPEPAPDGMYLTLRVEKIRFKEEEREASGVVWLYAPALEEPVRREFEELELRYGARLSVMVALRRADSFRNPGVSSFTEYLERRGYDATGTIKSPLLIERLDDARVFLPLAMIYEWRARLLTLIGERFKAETAGVLKAALLGNRMYLSHSTAERFRQGGTFHILVISGLHISFIGGLIFLIMRRLTKRRAWQFALSIIVLWCYAIAVGAESSVVRAALMFTVIALAPILHRRARSLNALGFSALALLLWRPSELFDPSFQLTFLSVLAIVTLAWPLLQRTAEIGRWRPSRETPHPPVCPRVLRLLGEALFWSERQWRREMERSIYSYRLWKTPVAGRLERWHIQGPLRYGFAALVVSASVQVVLLPLLVLYFHRLPIASLILNIGVGAMMAALALLSLAGLLLAELNPLIAAPLIWTAEHVNWLMVHSVDPLMHAHIASMRLPEYHGPAASLYVLYYLPLMFMAASLAGWHPLQKDLAGRAWKLNWTGLTTRAAAVALAAVMALIIFHPLSAPRPDGRLRADFLDVGQGDAALVTMPDGTTLLVDGGGRPSFDRSTQGSVGEGGATFERDTRSIGEMVVSEYLWWRGLDSVDYILATHADADHIDGLNDVLRNFHVRAALVGRAPMFDPEYRRFSASAAEMGVPVYVVGQGDQLQLGGVLINVLWPERTANQSAPSRNDDSVVLRMRFGQRTILLTGDIEKTAEAALVKAQWDLRSDALKVAHHGSRTSSIEAFVMATSPQYAIISVGLDSIFGHPHEEVLERWRASGAQVLITGRRGTITISTDGDDMKVETFVND